MAMSVGSASEGTLALAFSKEVFPRAVRVALVVGTLLALINHGDNIVTLSLSSDDLIKVLLTYLVPYGVSTFSAVRALKAQANQQA